MKRGQAWGLDLMVGMTLFLIGVIFFFLYSLNYLDDGRQKIDDLYYEGNSITEDLMSNGFPENWNESNVIRIGLLSNNKINETKLELFYNLSTTNYQRTREIFNTKYNYFMNFTDTIAINGQNISGIGTLIDSPKNLIKITRFTSYKNKPTTLKLLIWEQ